MLKKFRSDKINGTKNAIFFLSLAPTHHTSAFNLRFLRGEAQCLSLSKTVFKSVFDSILFLLKFAFLFSKMHGIFWPRNFIISFKIKIKEKLHTVFNPSLCFSVATRSFQIQWYLRVLGLPKNWPADKFFKNAETSFENVRFSQ